MKIEKLLQNKKILIDGPAKKIETINYDDFDYVIKLNQNFKDEDYDILYHNMCSSCINLNDFNNVIKHIKKYDKMLFLPYPEIYPFKSNYYEKIKQSGIKYHIINLETYNKYKINTRLNTGLLSLIDMLDFNVNSIFITNFTFYETEYDKSYYNAKISLKLHNQELQKELLKKILEENKHVNVDNRIKEILKIK